ncbi:MAG: 50S ribosomal protein L9 [Candidatus Pacebacteria bacterium]|nr:50S ribosomal protein L9 [Candidatus Paceibacterota bacterium]
MKVILKKDVQNLGNMGDVKEISDGYARNFLIPGGYAEVATKILIVKSEEEKTKRSKKAEEDLKVAEEIASEIEGTSITLKNKADEKGKLYAAVKAEEISEELISQGFNLDKSKVILKEPIKELGEYEVIIDFTHGLEAKIKLIVISE